jgi:hypothetical protein
MDKMQVHWLKPIASLRNPPFTQNMVLTIHLN